MPYWCDIDLKIIALNGRCRLSLDGVGFLVFRVVFFWNCSVAYNGLCVLNFLCTLWVGVACKTRTLWYGSGVESSGTGTLLDWTGRNICDIIGVGVTIGRMIVFFLVAITRSSDIFTSECLVMSPYYSDGTTDSVLWRMEIMSADGWLR